MVMHCTRTHYYKKYGLSHWSVIPNMHCVIQIPYQHLSICKASSFQAETGDQISNKQIFQAQLYSCSIPKKF